MAQKYIWNEDEKRIEIEEDIKQKKTMSEAGIARDMERCRDEAERAIERYNSLIDQLNEIKSIPDVGEKISLQVPEKMSLELKKTGGGKGEMK